jgi:PAS domain S-box-containing protein
MHNITNQEGGLSNRYEVFFKHASIGIVIVNALGEIISANPFLLGIFQYEEPELLGKKIEVLIPNRFHHKHHSHRDNFIQHPNSRPMGIGMDLFGIKKDGSEFPVEVSLSNYQFQDEKFVVAFVSDITIREANKAEIQKVYAEMEAMVENRTKELSRTLQVLELINKKLEISLLNQKAILNHAGVMLFAMNEEGFIQFFNSEATRLTGYTEEEVVKKHTPTIFHHETEIEICKEELYNEFGIVTKTSFDVIKEKSIRNQIHEMSCKYVNKNGGLVPISLTITPVRDKDNEITGFMGVAIDISERKKAESNLLEALSKEKKLGELKSRFVSMASHEFRTPLSTILSSAYLVEKYVESEEQPKREKHLARIISSVNNLTNILNEFLSVGKIEEGKIGVHLTDFNIKKLIDSILQDLKSMLKTDQQIEYQHTGIELVHLDASLLRNIILNLLSNAIKFSPSNSTIVINTNNIDDHVELMVKDNGIGISKEDQEHLMERFFRASNATNIQGTGLGLHIVSKYVERLNGIISYTSELNEGTTFTIHFKPQKTNDYENNTTD